MDVKYIQADWEKMRKGIGDLIGLGRWGKGMIDDLKDVSNNLEDAASYIRKYDSDGVISFQHTSQQNHYKKLYEKFNVLHTFSGKVGDIVDRTIDQPFYEDLDAFVEAMRDLSISNYTTDNRIGATETKTVITDYHTHYGSTETIEVPKAEVTIDDLFSGDNFYAEQMKLEYDAWKELNPDQDFSQEDYQLAAVNTRAFGYESIRNQQENKEFWANIAALAVMVGAGVLAFVFPPVGVPLMLGLGALYGTMELSSAVSGKDWASRRELGTGERWVRGLLSPLDIVPGVSSLKKFSTGARTVTLGIDAGKFGLKTGVKGALQKGKGTVDTMVKVARDQFDTRLRSLTTAIKDKQRVVKQQLAHGAVEAGKVADNVVTGAKTVRNNIRATFNPEERMAMAGVGHVEDTAKNTHRIQNTVRDWVNKFDVNIGGGKGGSGAGGGVSKEEYKALRKKTPNAKVRKSVNPEGPKFDPVYGYEVDKFEADHIVSMKEITEMEGFNQLTRKQQIEVLNLEENFIGLGKSTNASKGSSSWVEWKGHSELGKVSDEVRQRMLKLEEQAREALKKAIEERLK